MENSNSSLTRRYNIYHCGPSLKTRGGISSVIALYLSHYRDRFAMTHISTYLGRFRLWDLFYFARALVSVTGVSLFDKRSFFHIHTASKGSFFRKSIIADTVHHLGRPYLMHIHGGMFHEFIRRSSPKRKRRIVRILTNAQRVIVLSDWWHHFFSSVIPRETIVRIYNPSSTTVRKGTPARLFENETVSFVFLGKISRGKGVFDLVSACGMLGGKRYAVSLYGDGETETLKAHMKRCSVCDGVFTVRHWIPHEQVQSLYDRFDVLLLPSYAEGLPMVVLEAMGKGLAIIATDVGGIPELVKNGDNGFLIRPGDVAALAKSMMRLIDDTALLRRMRWRSEQIAYRSFSVEVIGNELATMYAAVFGTIRKSGRRQDRW